MLTPFHFWTKKKPRLNFTTKIRQKKKLLKKVKQQFIEKAHTPFTYIDIKIEKLLLFYVRLFTKNCQNIVVFYARIRTVRSRKRIRIRKLCRNDNYHCSIFSVPDDVITAGWIFLHLRTTLNSYMNVLNEWVNVSVTSGGRVYFWVFVWCLRVVDLFFLLYTVLW